jgi:hypothetical protein
MTSAAKSHFVAACLLIIFAQTVAGCAFLLSLDQIPRERVMPSDSNAVIVGIHVSSPGTLFTHPLTADQIFFVKLEDGSSDNILQGQILSNSHFRFGYAFLPNAKPGRYAAIGCTFHSGGSLGYRFTYTVLFDRALITRLTRTIAPGTVALLGNIVVSETFEAQEAEYDDVQQHYFRKLTGKDIRTVLKQRRGFFIQGGTLEGVPGRLKQEYPLDSASRQFLEILLQGLPTAWQPWFDKSGGPGP